MDASSRVDLVKSELQLLPGKKRMSPGGVYSMIACPYHSDGNPSGRVTHDPSLEKTIGTFRCYACGERRKWDVFANENGLKPFSDKPERLVPEKNFSLVDQRLLPDEDAPNAFIGKEDYILYPLNERARQKLELESDSWRGFSFSFLTQIGGRLMKLRKEDDALGSTVSYYVFLPVYINSELRGYIKALPRKWKDMGYLNAPGPWSRTAGLFPYDYAVSLMKSKGLTTLVLVEGPRDALRLLRDGVPTVSILGTQSWSEEKIALIESSGATEIILCFDGDKAGKKATKLVYTGENTSRSKDGSIRKNRVAPPLKDVLNVFSFDLWTRTDGEKLDPFEMPAALVRELRSWLE